MKTDIVNHTIKLLLKQGSKIKTAAQAIFLSLAYLINFTVKYIKKALLYKKTPIIVIVGVFMLFSYFDVNAIYKNSFDNSILYQLINKEKVIIETGVNDILENKQEKENHDFKIAAIRETNTAQKQDLILSLNNSTLVIPDTEYNKSVALTRTEIEKYIVQPGDTLSEIAEKFNINISSILWENNLTLRSVIRPGSVINIMPVSGLKHKIKSGENLQIIAKKYKTTVDKIVEFNNLADASDIFINDVLIIPDGKKPAPPKPKRTARARAKNENIELISTPPDYKTWLYSRKRACHRFYPGQCTSWVSYKWATDLGKCVTWTGHAKSWIGNAKWKGFEIGSEPAIGAIISLKEAGWAARIYGHVAYVESYDDKYVYFSEMNFRGSWRVTKRKYKLDSPNIIGYIYP